MLHLRECATTGLNDLFARPVGNGFQARLTFFRHSADQLRDGVPSPLVLLVFVKSNGRREHCGPQRTSPQPRPALIPNKVNALKVVSVVTFYASSNQTLDDD